MYILKRVVSKVCLYAAALEGKPQDCGCQDLCKFQRIHYGLAKNACSQCSKSRTDTHKVKCRFLFQLARFTNRACCQSHPVYRCLLRQQCPVIRKTRRETRLTKYLLVCLEQLSAIQCLECALMTHLLFISRSIEADRQ
jgi:hypothetical protein